MKLTDRRIFFLLPASMLAFAGVVSSARTAAEPLPQRDDAAQESPAAPQTDIAALLQMQRSGQYASPNPQTLPGDAQSLAWKRYLDSFSHPMPERYINDAFREK